MTESISAEEFAALAKRLYPLPVPRLIARLIAQFDRSHQEQRRPSANGHKTG